MRFPPRLSKLARIPLPSPMQRKHVPIPTAVAIARSRLVLDSVRNTGRRRVERHSVLDRRWGDAGREREVTFRREEGRVVCMQGRGSVGRCVVGANRAGGRGRE